MALIPAEIIRRKRNGETLSAEELVSFFKGYMSGAIPEYQTAALLMAIYFKGLTASETAALTRFVIESGQQFRKDFPFPRVDKHSTGGVGDKTSLIIAPLIASAGVGVPMVAGRGLGHTGGTLDKLESIPGFNTRMSLKEAEASIAKHHFCFMGQTDEICPVDRRLYSLRDVTGTVESIPLISASIMSKKLAENLDGLVLDIKFGSGAFMKDPEQAEVLARSLLDVAEHSGLRAAALLTTMNQPLGKYAGNALEVSECLEIMKTPKAKLTDPFTLETRRLSLELSAWMLFSLRTEKTLAACRERAEALLESGVVYKKFEDICKQQGGSLDLLPKALHSTSVAAKTAGFVQKINTEQLGYALVELGAGRKTISDVIDVTAGLEFHKKIGHPVQLGEPIFTIFGNNPALFPEAERRLSAAVEIGSHSVPPEELLLKTLTTSGFM